MCACFTYATEKIAELKEYANPLTGHAGVSWRIRQRSLERHERRHMSDWDTEVDVLVVGAGGAGLAAAVAGTLMPAQ